MSDLQTKANPVANDQPATSELTESQLEQVTGGITDGTSNTIQFGEHPTHRSNNIIAILIG
jgi:bacteriocin-like protein